MVQTNFGSFSEGGALGVGGLYIPPLTDEFGPTNEDYVGCDTLCPPPDGGSAITGCHLRFLPDGGAVSAGDGGAMLVCTYGPTQGICAGAQPCEGCQQDFEQCAPNTGACTLFCGAGLGGLCAIANHAFIPASLFGADSGVEQSCFSYCPVPDAGTILSSPSCHFQLQPNGQPVQCDGQDELVCLWFYEFG